MQVGITNLYILYMQLIYDLKKTKNKKEKTTYAKVTKNKEN